MAEYPAVTVWQPWASLIAIDAKPWEFRGRRPPDKFIGKRIAIHAAARDMRRQEVADLLNSFDHDAGRTNGLVAGLAIDLLEAVWRHFGSGCPPVIPTSAVVCLVTLGEPLRNAELAEKMGIEHVNDSDRDEHSNWGWPMQDVEQIHGPHPHVRGLQGWFYWQDHRV